LGQYSGPQPEETKTKPKLIKAYVEWLTNFKESLETTSDDTQLGRALKNSVEEQINFLNSEQVLSMQAPQINRQMNSFHENLKQNYNNIPEFDIPVQSTGTTAESLRNAATKAAFDGTPIKDMPRQENMPTVRAEIAEKDQVQEGKKENEDKFELHFFRAYLEERQNIRENFENLQKNTKTAGTLVYHAIDNLDSNFYKNIKPPPHQRPRRITRITSNTKNIDDDSDDDSADDVNRKLPMTQELTDSPNSQTSIGGRKKTRKRNKKHLLRMRRKL
jgi:hypothetical protein